MQLQVFIASSTMLHISFTFHYTEDPQVSHSAFGYIYGPIDEAHRSMTEGFTSSYNSIPHCKRSDKNEIVGDIVGSDTETNKMIVFSDWKRQTTTVVQSDEFSK